MRIIIVVGAGKINLQPHRSLDETDVILIRRKGRGPQTHQ